MHTYPGGQARRLPKAYSRVVSSKLSLSDFEVPLLTRQWVRIDRVGRAKLVTVREPYAAACAVIPQHVARRLVSQLDRW